MKRGFRKAISVVLSVQLSLVMLVTMCAVTVPTVFADTWDGTYTDGSGFSGNTIYNARGLAYFLRTIYDGNSYSGQTVYLATDVDLNGIDMSDTSPYNSDRIFQGTFDGQNHTIANFRMTHDNHRVAMFRTAKNATFKNVTFTNVFIDDWAANNKKNGFAVLVGYGDGDLTFENVHINGGYVYGYNYVGGLVGEYGANNVATFTNCSNSALIYADNDRAAGLVGHSKGRVYATNCTNEGEIYAAYSDAGGLAGWVEDDESYFVNCTNTGNVSTDSAAGGMVGYFGSKSNDNKMTITGCVNRGNITSRKSSDGGCAGGMAGKLDTDATHEFTNNVNYGAITATGESAGGIVGKNVGGGTWNNCKNYGSIYGQGDNAGGLLGEVEDDKQTFYNCLNAGYVESRYTGGGIMGWGADGDASSFERCFNYGNVSAGSYGGGILGGHNGGSSSNHNDFIECMNAGNVESSDNGGGMVGEGNWTYITRCFNMGAVSRKGGGTSKAYGGLIGWDVNDITDSYNVGSVTYGDCTGGLIGGDTHGSYNNCYNAGACTGGNKNRQIKAQDSSGSFTNCWSCSSVSGETQWSVTDSNGLRDLQNTLNSNVYCKDTWGINNGYPILKWWRDNYFKFPVQLIDGSTNVIDSTYDYNAGFTAPARSKTGYTFNGWYTASSGGSKVWGPSATTVYAGVTAPLNTCGMTINTGDSRPNVLPGSSPLKYYAQYTINTYNVSFTANGTGYTNTTPASTVTHGGSVSFSVTLSEGYTNSANPSVTATNGTVSASKNGNTITYTVSNITAATTISVGAATKNTYDVTFSANGTGYTNTAPASTVTHGGSVSFTVTLSDGYTNSANPSVTATNGVVSASKSGNTITYTVSNITAATTVSVGAATINSYTVTFKDGYTNETLKTEQVNHGSAATAPNPADYHAIDGDNAKHMKFTGWDNAFDNVTGTLTVTAQYAQEDHGYGAYASVDGNGHARTCGSCGYVDTAAHNYLFDSFVWAADNTSAQVKVVCEGCNDEQLVDASMSEDAHEAVCGADAYTVYTATYGGETDSKTVTLAGTALTHNYLFDSFVWAADNTSAQVKVVCEHCRDEQLVDASMSENAHEAVCGADAYTVYTATYGGETDSKTVTYAGTALTHNYLFDSFVWTADNTSAQVKVICEHCSDEQLVDASMSADAHEAVCGADAYTVYTATYGGETDSKTVTYAGTALTHNYLFDSFVWAADNTSAQVKVVCEHCRDEQLVDASMSENAHEAVCGADAYTVYTATYGSETDSRTVTYAGTALTHNYLFDSFIWAEDNTTAQVKVVCERCNDEQLVDASMSEDAHEAVCGADAYTVYTATYGGETDSKTVTYAGTALTHNYLFDSFVWAADNTSAQVKVVCEHCSDEQLVDASMSEDAHEAVCGADAYTVYTATYGSETDSKTVTYAGTALTHNYLFDSFVWAADNKTAQVKLVCEYCSDEQLVDASMSEDAHAAVCGADAYTVYTATYGGETDSKTVTYAGTALTHNYLFDSFVWAADNTSAQVKVVCEHCSDEQLVDASMSEDAHSAACGADAYTVYTAAYGGETDSRTVTYAGTALTHDLIYTPNGDGTHSVTCRNCDYADTGACSFGGWTSDLAGHLLRTCSVCGYTEQIDDNCLEITISYSVNSGVDTEGALTEGKTRTPFTTTVKAKEGYHLDRYEGVEIYSAGTLLSRQAYHLEYADDSSSVTITLTDPSLLLGDAVIKLSAEKHNNHGMSVTSNATCTEEGYIERTCAECGTTWRDTLPALGHADLNKDGVCDRCGYIVDETLAGDTGSAGDGADNEYHCWCGQGHPNNLIGWIQCFFTSLSVLLHKIVH